MDLIDDMSPAKSYEATLKELNTTSKIEINGLTMLAEENMDHAIAIAACIENQLKVAPKDRKLPILYLIDSICKNCKNSRYIELFTQNIVSNFCNAFKVSDSNVRRSLEKLRKSWGEPAMKIFPQTKLEAIDERVRIMDPNWMKHAQLQQQNAKQQSNIMVKNNNMNQAKQIVVENGYIQYKQNNSQTNNSDNIGRQSVALKRPSSNNNARRSKRIRMTTNNNQNSNNVNNNNNNNTNINSSNNQQHLQPQQQHIVHQQIFEQQLPILPMQSMIQTADPNHIALMQLDQQQIPLIQQQDQQILAQDLVQLQHQVLEPQQMILQQAQQQILLQPLPTQPVPTALQSTPAVPIVGITPTGTVNTTTPLDDQSKSPHSHILDSLYGGKQCSSCSLRFDYNDKYAYHLDWHFRQNSNNVKKVRQRQWYCPLDLWVKFREINDDDIEKNTNNNPEILINEGEVPSAPLFKEDEKNICSVCHESFEKFWAEEDEEWRLKNASLYEDMVYHPLCLKDMLQATSPLVVNK